MCRRAARTRTARSYERAATGSLTKLRAYYCLLGVAAVSRRNRNTRDALKVRAGDRGQRLTCAVLRGAEFIERRIDCGSFLVAMLEPEEWCSVADAYTAPLDPIDLSYYSRTQPGPLPSGFFRARKTLLPPR